MADPLESHGHAQRTGDPTSGAVQPSAEAESDATAPVEAAALAAERDRLLAENAELQTLNRRLSGVVNHLAHELRTPLTSITGFSEFLLKSGARQTPEKLRYYCEILFLESSRLSRMVDSLLDLSRMHAGKTGLSLERCSLGALASQGLRNLEIQAREKKIQLTGAVPSGLPDPQADPDKLLQVLTNLVSNAIHYSPEGASIEVGARLQDGQLVCWVRDTGIGIAPEHHERIFDEFYRVDDKASASTVKGTGLGLPITRTIVEMHGGRIWVESTVGQGSTFWFTLPLGA
jgi:two-component system phosphate regulon sensor histidine kinase PhoR